MDESIVLTLHAWAASQAWLASVIALLADAGMFVLPAALAWVWFRSSRADDSRREAVVVGIVAASVAFAVTLVVEQLLSRPRPFVALGFDPLLPHARYSSFPSDHTLLGVALGGPLFWRAPKLGGWLVAWALFVGLARVAAGVHYPSDIAGSAILGLLVDALVWVVLRPVLGRLNLRRWDAHLLGSPPGERRR